MSEKSGEDWFDIASNLENCGSCGNNNSNNTFDLDSIPDFGVKVSNESHNDIPNFNIEILEKGVGTRKEFFYLQGDQPSEKKDNENKK